MKRLDETALSELGVATSASVAMHASAVGDVLLRRGEYLPRRDRLILTLYLRLGYSQRKIAEHLQMPHGTVSRRVKALGRLLRDPMIVRLLDGPCPLEPNDRQLALEVLVQRLPLREVAKTHQMSPSQVRQRLEFVRGWWTGASGR